MAGVSFDRRSAERIAQVTREVEAWRTGNVRRPNARPPQRAQVDIILRNISGGDLPAWSVLGIEDPVITDPMDDEFVGSLLFEGDTPTTSHRMGQFAVTTAEVEEDADVACVRYGIVTLQVDIRHADHHYCDVNPSETDRLQSNTWGWARILWRESGTGLKWAKVDLGRFEDTLIGKANGAISAGASGTAHVWETADTGVDETVVHDWIDGAQNISSGKELMARWFDNKRALRVFAAECESP